MREFIIDKFNTWADWRLTLTGKDVTPAEPKTNYVELDGASGTLDLSEALTGEPVYKDRTVSATFWTSEGSYRDRLNVVRQIINATHGKRVQIIEPDDPEHFFLGRVQVKSQAWDQVHVELSVEAVCEPWRYAIEETERTVPVSGAVDAVIVNNGDKTLWPTLNVKGTVVVKVNGTDTTLTPGSYKLTNLKLKHGPNIVSMTGAGSVTFVYREAEL